jgi:thioredoxin reductase (NADPH)
MQGAETRQEIQMAKRRKVECVILGSGPAGKTAAIYTTRANLETVVIEGIQPGGQLTITTDVENFPGFEEPIKGPELMERMRKQAERLGAQFISDSCESVDLSKRPFTVRTSDEEIITDTLIICTGASAKFLGLESEEKFLGHGVSTCATCDGFFFKGKDVFVIGGGDVAMEEAFHLAGIANSVTVVHRKVTFRASPANLARAQKHKKIKFILDSVLDEVLGTDKVTGIKVKNLKTNKVDELKADGVFIAIGHKPNTELFQGKLALNDGGYIVTTHGVKTSVEGVFAAGDVQDFIYRQAITAAGFGCAAALEAQRFLEGQEAKTTSGDNAPA